MTSHISSLVLAVVIAANALVAAGEHAPEWFEHACENAWLLPYDTTLINRCSFAEFSYEDRDDISSFELKFPAVFKLPDQWSGIASYKPKWDLLSEWDRHRIELGASRLLGPEIQLAL